MHASHLLTWKNIIYGNDDVYSVATNCLLKRIFLTPPAAHSDSSEKAAKRSNFGQMLILMTPKLICGTHYQNLPV